VTALLRFVGILNAAVWCGSAIFLTIGLPAVFSPGLKTLLTAPGVGFAAEAVVARFFMLQYWCGAIALAHLLAEWIYCGRPVRRLNLALVLGLLALALAGGLWAQPKMRTLHQIKYFGKKRSLQAQAAEGLRALARGLGIGQFAGHGGLILYLWRVSGPPERPRFGGFSKIRG
jgi:hypothetical protein